MGRFFLILFVTLPALAGTTLEPNLSAPNKCTIGSSDANCTKVESQQSRPEQSFGLRSRPARSFGSTSKFSAIASTKGEENRCRVWCHDDKSRCRKTCANGQKARCTCDAKKTPRAVCECTP